MDTKKLRQKILDLAIHGKLVPQDPNDEPASVLLERIRAEKERLIAEGKIKRSKKSATSDTSHYENVPFEVPEGWCWCRLDTLCDIKGGKRVPRGMSFSDAPTSHVYIRVTNMKKNTIIDNELKYIDDEVFSYIRNYIISKSDLYLTIAGTIGDVGEVPDKYDMMNLTENAAKLTNIICNRKYLMYSLLSSHAQEHFSSKFHQVAQPKLSIETASSTFVPIPPMEEQKRIVAKIEELLTIIDLFDNSKLDLELAILHAKSKILDLAIHGKLVPQDPNDEPASELLKRINPKFVPCDNAHCQYRFPIYWELVKLEDVCEFIRNGVSIRQIKGANGIPITRIETISNGIVDRDRMGYADIIDDTYEKYYLQHGDILMSHINSPIHLGKSALYESIEGEKIIHGMNLLCLRMKTGICPKYMNYLFMSEIFKDEIRPYIKNAVNQASINTRNLGGVYSPIPPYNEQQRIVTKIEELFAVLDEIQKSIEA